MAGRGSGTDPALVAPTVKASFSEDVADGLPPAERAPPWSIASGTWATTSGQAVAIAGSSPALATIAAESIPLRAQIQLPAASAGAGLAFDVVGPTDFLAWVALPAYGNVNLVRVAGGAVTALASSGLTAVEPGVHLGIRLEADRVELLANGVVVAVYDGARAGTAVGLVALRSSAAAFDDFVVQYG